MPKTKLTTRERLQKELATAQRQQEETLEKIEALKTAEPSISSTDEIVAIEIARAKLQEQSRVERAGLMQAAIVLKRQIEAKQAELNAASVAEDKARVQAVTKKAIAEMQAIQSDLTEAVNHVKDILSEAKQTAEKYSDDVWQYARYQAVGYEGNQPVSARLLVCDKPLTFPVMVQRNGIDSAGNDVPIHHYGELFCIIQEEPYRVN